MARATGDVAAVLRYAGGGGLQGLLAVSATRVAMNLLERRQREAPLDDSLLAAGDWTDDAGLAQVKQAFGPIFKQAFEEAVGLLSARQRTLLRMHYVDGVSASDLARLFGAHRATATRWLVQARARVRAAALRALRQRARHEVDDGLRALIDTQLELSLVRLLATQNHRTRSSGHDDRGVTEPVGRASHDHRRVGDVHAREPSGTP